MPRSARLAALVLASCSIALRASAVSANWSLNPANGDWNVPSNWTSMAAPNGPADVASFGVSTITDVFLSADTQVDSIVFSPGASAYTIAASPARTLTISGVGILNHSGITQTLVAAGVQSSGASGLIRFTNNAAVGGSTSLISSGSSVANREGALIEFRDGSSASAGSVTANGGAADAGGGARVLFRGFSSAGQAFLTSNGGSVVGGNRGMIFFAERSTAAQARITTNGGLFGQLSASFIGGLVAFGDDASAAQAIITNHGGNVANAGGGSTGFGGNSSAETAFISNYGGTVDGSSGGGTSFGGNATAGDSVIISHGGAFPFASGGSTLFLGKSSAGAATLIAYGGMGTGPLGGGEISFERESTGGTAHVEVSGNGFLNIRQHTAGGVTIGSLGGTGQVFLGNNTLTIGSNNRSTEFSGSIRDGGPFGPDPVGGSITKLGTGTLVLSGQNTYTGQTLVTAGELIINGSVLTPVLVNGGTLGGTGSVGATTIGDGATLSPGDGRGVFHVAGDLTLTLGATYRVDVNGAAVGTAYDQTVVGGGVELGGAALSLQLGYQPLPGMTFMIVENDGDDATSGVFGGLPEGAMFTAGGQAFNISYRGGSGNDVVLLAIVPEPTIGLLLSAGAALLSASLYCGRRRRHPPSSPQLSPPVMSPT